MDNLELAGLSTGPLPLAESLRYFPEGFSQNQRDSFDVEPFFDWQSSGWGVDEEGWVSLVSFVKPAR